MSRDSARHFSARSWSASSASSCRYSSKITTVRVCTFTWRHVRLAPKTKAQQFTRPSAAPDKLQAARQAVARRAAGQRNGRMTGQVEELREPQHDRPQILFRASNGDSLHAEFRSGYRQRWEHQRIARRERGIDIVPQHSAIALARHVFVLRDLAAALEPRPNAFGQRLRTALERP